MNLYETSALGSGSWVMSNGREKGWDIPSAPFRDGREICHPPHSLQIFSPRRKGLRVYIFGGSKFPLLAPKGICESAAFALAELGSCFAGSSCVVPWPFGTGLRHRRLKAVSKCLLPCAGSLGFPRVRAAAQEGIPQLLGAAASCVVGGRLFLPWE